MGQKANGQAGKRLHSLCCRTLRVAARHHKWRFSFMFKWFLSVICSYLPVCIYCTHLHLVIWLLSRNKESKKLLIFWYFPNVIFLFCSMSFIAQLGIILCLLTGLFDVQTRNITHIMQNVNLKQHFNFQCILSRSGATVLNKQHLFIIRWICAASLMVICWSQEVTVESQT